MQKPPNLVADNAKGYSDARVFHVISAGQNIMPGYADKLKEEDRWAIVHYVRELQKAPLKYPAIPSAPSDTTDGATGQRGNASTAGTVQSAGAPTPTENTEQVP
jgi:hypothetical protein